MKFNFNTTDWAILCATQEAQGNWDSEQNLRDSRELEEILFDSFPTYNLTGYYQGVDQGQSFLVTQITELEALDLAEHFGQESILTHRGLVYVDGRIVPRDESRDVFGEEAKSEDFYSVYENGEAFSLGLNFEGEEQ